MFPWPELEVLVGVHESLIKNKIKKSELTFELLIVDTHEHRTKSLN